MVEVIGWLCPYCNKWTMIDKKTKTDIYLWSCKHLKKWNKKLNKPIFKKD